MKPILSILLHGDAGVGKSWLAGTAPAPLLVLDAEGRGRYLPRGPKIEWDPLREEPPAAGDWNICVVNVANFDILGRVFQWLQSGQHCFRSVALDSLMEIQKRYIDQLVGMEQLQTQHWGDVLRHLESLVRNYRDLVLTPSNTVDCVVFTVGTKVNDNGRYEPLLQGSLRQTLPYYMDAVGYLYVTQDVDGSLQRNLLVQPTQTIVAKDGTGRLGGPVIVKPDLTEMFNALTVEGAVS